MTDNRTVEGLRALAEKAKPGPWVALGKDIYLGDEGQIYDEGGHNADDAAYIAAVDPQTLLRLLDVVDAARNYSPRDDHDWRCELRTKEAGWMPSDSPVIRCECGYNELRAALDRLDETGKPG